MVEFTNARCFSTESPFTTHKLHKTAGLGESTQERERVKENGKKSAASTFWLITKLFDWMYRFWWMGSRQETLIIFHVMTFNEPPSHSHILNEINECAVCSLFGRPLFHSHGTNMHEKVSIHCPYNFGHDKRQRCELIACVMQRHCNKTIFFHSVCLCVLANVASAKRAKVRRKWTLNKKRTILFQRFFCLLFFFLLLLFPFLPFFVVISVCVRDGVTCFVLCHNIVFFSSATAAARSQLLLNGTENKNVFTYSPWNDILIYTCLLCLGKIWKTWSKPENAFFFVFLRCTLRILFTILSFRWLVLLCLGWWGPMFGQKWLRIENTITHCA